MINPYLIQLLKQKPTIDKGEEANEGRPVGPSLLWLVHFWSIFDLKLIKILMIIPQLDSGIKSQTTTVVKGLTLSHGSCVHTNIVKVSRAERDTEDDSPQVTTMAKEQENRIIRYLTEIKFHNRDFTVEDIYDFSLNHAKESIHARPARSFISSSYDSKRSSGSDQSKRRARKRSNKKVCLFQKTGRRGHRYRKRNTKNIPKNFCKAFANFMEDHVKKSSAQWGTAIKVLKKIETRDKYNNITMKKMMQNPTVVPFFKEFLVNYAEHWIRSSKIADKEVHIQAIKIYLNFLEGIAYAEVDPSPSDEG